MKQKSPVKKKRTATLCASKSRRFVREHRYIVIKTKDAKRFLNARELADLEAYGNIVKYGRRWAGKKDMECVVVESDWPEYEPTWKSIETRMLSTKHHV